MKKFLFGISFLVLVFMACKKESGTKSGPSQNIFTFKYNGTIYNSTVTNNISNGGAINSAGTPGVFIDMPSVFGGRIFYLRQGCAYLEPGNNVIYETGTCQLSVHDNFGNQQPIDSVQVYLYQSGSLNISFSDCETKSGTDVVTGLPYSYEVCRASGTFDLTLVNKNNQTIKITNGEVDEKIQL